MEILVPKIQNRYHLKLQLESWVVIGAHQARGKICNYIYIYVRIRHTVSRMLGLRMECCSERRWGRCRHEVVIYACLLRMMEISGADDVAHWFSGPKGERVSRTRSIQDLARWHI